MPSKKPIVLLVDDEVDILESIESLLKSDLPDVDVRVATSGPRALQIMAQEKMSLIVTDYRMPGMNGLELLAKARRF